MPLKAHVIRDRGSLRYRAVCGLTARYRWCLTGTPIHNKVDDYGALISFLRVVPFNDQQYFSQQISYHIKSKKNTNGFEKLEKLVRATSLRRTKITEQIGLDLPPRETRTECVELNEEERNLHEFFKTRASKIIHGDSIETKHNRRIDNVFPTITKLRQICNHGRRLLSAASLAALSSCGNPGFFFDTSQGPEASIHCDRLLTASEMDISPSISVRKDYFSGAEPLDNKSDGSMYHVFSKSDSQHGIDVNSASKNSKTVQHEAYEPSSKVSALMKNLQLDRLSNHSPPLKRWSDW